MNIYYKKELSSFIKTDFIPQNVPQNQKYFFKNINFLYEYAKKTGIYALISCINACFWLRRRDVSRAIDSLSFFENLDLDDITCVGNSGGGTATYYAACYDERIKMAIPSCAVCSYIESIGYTWHCSCNYIPNAAKYFDMGELAALIAPRKLLLSNGQIDHIFHIEGTREVYSVIEKIYKKAGAEGQCELYEHPKGHFFDKEAIFGKITRN